MLILSLARGGWVNTYYGNLDLLDEVQAAWFAKVQGLFMALQQSGRSSTFGGWPGRGEAYGFLAQQPAGALATVVNPSQSVATLTLPVMGRQGQRLLFRDAGFEPVLTAAAITLGPEQMAVVGLGCYANETHDLGVQDDVVIPRQIEPLTAEFKADGDHAIAATIELPANGSIRFGIQLKAKNGQAHRLSGGSPPKGKPLNELIQLSATQDGKPVAIRIEYGKQIWSGLSWAMGEIDIAGLRAGVPLMLRGCAECADDVTLTGNVYQVQY
jgi:hypothetical protein